jgi:propanediol utilization protein
MIASAASMRARLTGARQQREVLLVLGPRRELEQVEVGPRDAQVLGLPAR